jgi:hypothetical protein
VAVNTTVLVTKKSLLLYYLSFIVSLLVWEAAACSESPGPSSGDYTGMWIGVSAILAKI